MRDLFASLSGRWWDSCWPGPTANQTPTNPVEIRIRNGLLEHRYYGGRLLEGYERWDWRTPYMFDENTGLLVTKAGNNWGLKIISSNELHHTNGCVWRRTQ